ncbi:MAG: hypothetical protein RJA57_1852 [Bacteroidota bacterium]|jgi:HD superfamily phosphohydrolase
MQGPRKIINDPVYGFITIDHPVIGSLIAHPWFQRLRNIHQMAFAHLVYPGAVHSRLHHALGAYHLMCTAIRELRGKGTELTPEEELGAKIAILLHDIGHGPFSHALEEELIPDVSHETLSLRLMQRLNQDMGGALETAIAIFTGRHPKHFLHQLVSGQLDVDRMDYLNRDSFFTGVAEGVIGYDRILKMLTVHEGQLMVEEKAIYSIEKFLLSRRLMYWQVYLHKTVVCAEKTLQQVLHRAVETGAEAPSPFLNLFLRGRASAESVDRWLPEFCQLDDHDVMGAVKAWQFHPDKVLSLLCRTLVERKLPAVRLQAAPWEPAFIAEKKAYARESLGLTETEADYFVFTGEASNTLYNPVAERINILFRDGRVCDISEVDNALIRHTVSGAVKKYYICYPR